MSTEIELGLDCEERDEFASWLTAAGYSVALGNTTCDTYDGVIILGSSDAIDAARDELNALWERYCDFSGRQS